VLDTNESAMAPNVRSLNGAELRFKADSMPRHRENHVVRTNTRVDIDEPWTTGRRMSGYQKNCRRASEITRATKTAARP
jgi:hypothetical protein